MLQILVPIVLIGGVLWYFGIWPFDRSYSFLPKYTEWGNKKIDAPKPPKE